MTTDTDEFFEKNKFLLRQKLRQGRNTRRHMLAQLYIGEFMMLYGDGSSNRHLVYEPKFEYPINGEWCTDIFTRWAYDCTTFDEIIEVQSEYMWNISFNTAEEGVKIVKALAEEGFLSSSKADDYLKVYLKSIRKHEATNSNCSSYVGHIAFRSNQSLWDKTIGDWEINNESDLERKIRNATIKNPYLKSETYKGPKKFDYISFAVPWMDFGKFTRDVTNLEKKNGNTKIGCIYAYENLEVSTFDKKSRELVRIVGQNKNKNQKGRIKKCEEARIALEKLEQKMFVDYRKNNLRDFMTAVIVNIDADSIASPVIRLDTSANLFK